MNEERQKVNVKTETGETKEVEIISVVEIENKQYVVYAMKNEKDLYDIMASYLVKDANGFDSFSEIKDQEDKEKISIYIKNLFN